jgi:hypothetical protein
MATSPAAATFNLQQAMERQATGRRVYVREYTASTTLKMQHTGSVCTNYGATDTVTLTLSQSAVKGTNYTFVVQADYAVRVDPGAAGALYIDGAKQTDSYYVELSGIGTTLTVVCDGNGDWLATVNGTYQVQN